MFTCFTSSEMDQTTVVGEPCLFCKITMDHNNEVKKIVRKAKNHPKTDIEKFYTTPICSIKTPTGEKPLSLKDIELMYEKDFPSWNREFHCFPEAPIFHDKLFKKSPHKRAIDIEESIHELKEKVQSITKLPFDVEKDSDDVIIKKSLDSTVQSLQKLINHLELEENSRVKISLPKILKGKLTSNIKQLRDVTQVIGTLHEVQFDGFYLVLDNHKAFREQNGYYNMRSVLQIVS